MKNNKKHVVMIFGITDIEPLNKTKGVFQKLSE